MPVLEDALRGVVAGDRESMARFYDLSAGLSWRLALVMTGDRTRAARVVADTYWEVWLHASDGLGSPYAAQTWVLTVVRRHALGDAEPEPEDGGQRGVAVVRLWLLGVRRRLAISVSRFGR